MCKASKNRRPRFAWTAPVLDSLSTAIAVPVFMSLILAICKQDKTFACTVIAIACWTQQQLLQVPEVGFFEGL